MNLDLITDPELAPRPRDEVRIRELSVTPYPDGRRLRVQLLLTPFAPVDRPNLEITARRVDGLMVASVSVIESMQHHLNLTIHLRDPQPVPGEYVVQADLYYEPAQVQHSVSCSVVLPGTEPLSP